MKCPVDKADMIVVEHEKIEIDHCLKCAGVWFDSGELELLVSLLKAEGASSQADLLTPTQVEHAEASRKCPVCGHKMDKACLGKTKQVLVDSCPRGDGLWFDSGELHHVISDIEPSKTKAAQDVISFLGSAFQATLGTDIKK